PVLMIERLARFAEERAPERRLRGVAVVGVDQRHQRLSRAAELPLGQAVDAVELRRPDHLIAVDAPVPAAEVRHPLRLRQARLAAPELGLGAPLLGDVDGDADAADDLALRAAQRL